MKFGTPVEKFPYKTGDRVDVAVKVEKNEFKGEVRASVQVRDIRFSGVDEQERLRQIRLYEKFVRDEALSYSEIEKIKPDRDYLGKVYLFIKNNSDFLPDTETVLFRMKQDMTSFARLMMSLDVLGELGIVGKNRDGGFFVPDSVKKTDLSSSEILKKLERSQSIGR